MADQDPKQFEVTITQILSEIDDMQSELVDVQIKIDRIDLTVLQIHKLLLTAA